MKNYYEILEVDRNASQEVIEKAYKALAKKYHPDLQQGAMKAQNAEKMKIINEAYDILSDSAKREQYNEQLKDEEIQNQGISIEEQERILQENYALKQELNRMGSQQRYNQMQYQEQMNDGTIVNMSRILTQEINAARKQAYHDAYIQDMQNRGYRIRYKRSFKDYLKLFITIIITAFLCFLIYQIPIVKNFFQNLYNENIIFQAIVDIFKNTFSTQF